MADIKLKNLNERSRDGSVLVRASRVWEFRGVTDDGELQHIDLVFIDSEVLYTHKTALSNINFQHHSCK